MNFDLATLRQGLILYIILVASLCVHEWAHAITADKLGDDTPRWQGRVTLNPSSHMDLFGTVIFPLVCIFVFPGFLFGWGKPVMVNPSNFKRRRFDDVLVTLAGPGSNLLLALLAAVAGGLLFKMNPATKEIFGLIIMINVLLAVFNLIPLPPLDGGQVLRHLVGMKDETFLMLSRYSMLIFLVAIMLPPVNRLLGVLMNITTLPFATIYHLLAT